MLPRLLIAFALSLIALPLLAAQPAQVMLFGTFHFKDAGLDVAKHKDIDIFTGENQAYLEALTQRLQGFKPTRVLLEYNPENDELINERYREYLATNSIGAGDGYSGAVSSASWWERNFYMYANIQKLAVPGEHVIAIGGSGHMAILKQLLAIDRRLEGVSVDSYL